MANIHTSSPKVSVVLPIYNVEKYLPTCVDSVLAQTYRNLEVVLVDDGSTDGSGALCDLYASLYGVKVIHKENGGLSSARNAGLDCCEGEYVTFVDSDDWLDTSMVERCMGLIREFDADVCGVSLMRVYGNREVPNATNIKHAECYDTATALSKYLFNTNLTVCVCGKVWKRALWDEVRCPDGLLHEDHHTTFLLIERARRVVFNPEPLYYYRQREGSIGHSAFSEKSYDLIRGVDRQYEHISCEYPNIEGSIGAACSFWYMVFVNMMLRGDIHNDGTMRKCVSFTRRHLFDIVRTADFVPVRKVQLVLFAGAPQVYAYTYKLFLLLGRGGQSK